METIKKEIDEKEKRVDKEDEIIEFRKEFSFEELKKVWDKFAKAIKKAGRETDFAALKGELTLVEPEKAKLVLTNKFQKIAIESMKQDLLGYLRENLKNNFLELELEIQKIEEKDMRYTNKEKFDFMAEKYPHLKELKKRFDLDPDF